ncbi:F-box domain containing protein [Parasponia andersonii]|uniref:F-box domain containing protein n=1 Tax=Parasponia andersonii TaxID=3476 RepID=A0A2P5CAC9_PARAD|nr:F-box domain containing protein [Parasponia andersonii]
MDASMDPLVWLEPDMSLKILTSLEDPAGIICLGAVSRSWRQFVVANGLCKQLCLKMFPELSRVAHAIELKQHATEEDVELGFSSNWMEWESMVRDHRVYAFLARCCTSFVAENCIGEAISASSTDNYPRESISNTLESTERFSRRILYWSSKGQCNCEVPETLIYKLASDFCVITGISVQPFQAYFQEGLPIYSARGMRFRMGHPKVPLGLENVPVDEPCDEKFIWTYTSQVFQMAQLNRLQKFELPKPVLCIGGYLQIELLGRVQRQEIDGLFYICVSRVQVLGRLLAPALGVDILDSSGKFVLKQFLQADNSPINLPENKPNSINDIDPERRVRTLQRIVDLFRGNGGVNAWDADDADSDEELVF